MRRAGRRWAPSPLWRSAPWRLLRSGLWGPLVLGAFLLLATAGAAPLLFYADASDAAWRSTVDAVPVTARAADAPVVRLNGGAGPGDEREAALLDRLADVPGLGPPTVVAGSVGSRARPARRPRHAVRARRRPDRARAALRRAGAGRGARRRRRSRAWGRAVAARAGRGPPRRRTGRPRRGGGVAPGRGTGPGRDHRAGRGRRDVRRGQRRTASGRPAGSGRWTGRAGQLPADTEFPTLTAALLVGDLDTVQRLAEAVGDALFWTAETRLATPYPPLRDVERTAARVAVLAGRLTDAGEVSTADGPLRTGLVSGLPDLAADAVAVRDATVARTSTLAWAGVALGLLAVVAVAVLGTARRRLELALDAELGTPPLPSAPAPPSRCCRRRCSPGSPVRCWRRRSWRPPDRERRPTGRCCSPPPRTPPRPWRSPCCSSVSSRASPRRSWRVRPGRASSAGGCPGRRCSASPPPRRCWV